MDETIATMKLRNSCYYRNMLTNINLYGQWTNVIKVMIDVIIRLCS